MRGLGLEPATTTAAVTAAVKSQLVQRLSEGLRGFFGDTAKDRERKAQAVDALRRALDGDDSGIPYLIARAGIRSDGITPAAPRTARFQFRKALREYYIATNTLPDDQVRTAIWARESDMPMSLRNILAARRAGTASAGGLSVVTPDAMPSPMTPAPLQAGVGGASPLVLLLIATGVGFAILRGKK